MPYKDTTDFDYVIMGAGMGGTAIASLLANRGEKVCLLEAGKRLGGYSSTIRKKGYAFNTGVHYLMGCNKGGSIYDFLAELNLTSKIKFNSLNRKAFDVVSIEDLKIDIPHGSYNYENKLLKLYPGSIAAIKKYFRVLNAIYKEENKIKSIIQKRKRVLNPLKFLNVLKYRNYTLGQFFNGLKLPLELRGVLAAQAGNLAESPGDASFPMHVGMQMAYLEGAHFPARGMDFFIAELVRKVMKSKENKIVTDCQVKKIECVNRKVVSVKTSKGSFTAKNFISNIDPRRTFEMTNGFIVPRHYRQKLNYQYSSSLFAIYLGLKDIDLKQYGFGRKNIWHHSTFDIDREFEAVLHEKDYTHPFLFIGTPSLHTSIGTLCPAGCGTMVIMTAVSYDHFYKLHRSNKIQFQKLKREITEYILDIVEKKYLPGLRQHIEVQIVHTPVDLEKMFYSPRGNIYGCRIIPQYYNLNKLTHYTPVKNLYLVGAVAAYPGLMGVIGGSLDLYHRLINS